MNDLDDQVWDFLNTVGYDIDHHVTVDLTKRGISVGKMELMRTEFAMGQILGRNPSYQAWLVNVWQASFAPADVFD